jgi:hypothetical protein
VNAALYTLEDFAPGCAIAGRFPLLAPIPASQPLPAPDRTPARKKWSHNFVDVSLTYRRPWLPTSPGDHRPEANVWNLDEGASGLTVLAIVRVTDVSKMVAVTIPISKSRRRDRRMTYPIETGEVFAIEPFVHVEALPRVRLLLRDAPADVAAKLRAMT